jgi:hypothetical protein
MINATPAAPAVAGPRRSACDPGRRYGDRRQHMQMDQGLDSGPVLHRVATPSVRRDRRRRGGSRSSAPPR